MLIGTAASRMNELTFSRVCNLSLVGEKEKCLHTLGRSLIFCVSASELQLHYRELLHQMMVYFGFQAWLVLESAANLLSSQVSLSLNLTEVMVLYDFHERRIGTDLRV